MQLRLYLLFLLIFCPLSVPANAVESESVCSPATQKQLESQAASGDTVAAASLGMMNEVGLCDEPSLTDAKAWYLMAAARGDPNVQFRIGYLYYHVPEGRGGDKQQAFYWFEKAAENGLPGGMVMLANRYMLGEGVEKDLVKAYYWFAMANGGTLPNSFDSLTEQMTVDQLERARRLLRESPEK